MGNSEGEEFKGILLLCESLQMVNVEGKLQVIFARRDLRGWTWGPALECFVVSLAGRSRGELMCTS